MLRGASWEADTVSDIMAALRSRLFAQLTNKHLRYDSCIIQKAHLKCTIQCFLSVFMELCNYYNQF